MRWMASERGLSGSALSDVRTTCNDFENNIQRMRHHDFLRAGYPIVSGVIEGACRLVIDRMEHGRMRSTLEGAQARCRFSRQPVSSMLTGPLRTCSRSGCTTFSRMVSVCFSILHTMPCRVRTDHVGLYSPLCQKLPSSAHLFDLAGNRVLSFSAPLPRLPVHFLFVFGCQDGGRVGGRDDKTTFTFWDIHSGPIARTLQCKPRAAGPPSDQEPRPFPVPLPQTEAREQALPALLQRGGSVSRFPTLSPQPISRRQSCHDAHCWRSP